MVTEYRDRADLLIEQAQAAVDRTNAQLARTDAITASMDQVTANMAELSGHVSALAGLARGMSSAATRAADRGLAAVVFGLRRAMLVRRVASGRGRGRDARPEHARGRRCRSGRRARAPLSPEPAARRAVIRR